jgi:hypothetical protein
MGPMLQPGGRNWQLIYPNFQHLHLSDCPLNEQNQVTGNHRHLLYQGLVLKSCLDIYEMIQHLI